MQICIVDDEASVRRTFTRILQNHGFKVHTFSSSKEFLECKERSGPGCVLLDPMMPDIHGLEVQHKLQEEGSTASVVFISEFADIPTSVQAIKNGASDFLAKPIHSKDLLRAVQDACAKSAIIHKTKILATDAKQRVATLTPREFQILNGVAAGKLNKEIAFDLGIAEKTVKVHRSHVMQKLKIRNVIELIRIFDRVAVDGVLPGPEA